MSNTEKGAIRIGSQSAAGPAISRDLPLEDLHRNPHLRGLRLIFDTWMQAFLNRAALPQRLSVADIRAGGMLGNLHVFDVTADDPRDFFVIWWGANAAIYNAREGLFDRMGDLPSPAYSRWGATTLQATKSSRSARLQFVSSRHLTQTPPRHRLLLPLSDDGAVVDRIVSAWSYDTVERIG